MFRSDSRLSAIFPIFASLQNRTAGDWSDDFLAGTVTAILLVPQTLAYSLIAGLPPQMGLYAAIVPTIVYALTASSRLTVVGPVAVQSVMIGAALGKTGLTDPHLLALGGVVIAVTSGVLLLVLGLLRLGWLTNFISRPVLSGFTTGAAIFIVTTQLGSLVGISVPRDGTPLDAVIAMVKQADKANFATGVFGFTAVAFLVLARRPLARLLEGVGIRPAIAAFLGRAAPLAAVAIATFVSTGLHASKDLGVKVVGAIPSGLPDFNLDFLQYPDIPALLPSAILIAIVGYVETITVSKVLAFRRRQKIDPDRELVALGLSNIGAASFGAMPVASGFTKSSANFEAGAKAQFSSLVAAFWVALSAALFTGALHELPRAVLAAIIVVAVSKLIDFQSLKHNWSFSRGDGFSQAMTIVSVLVLGVETGLLTGCVLAAAFFLYRTSRPNVVVLGRVPGTEAYRSVNKRQVETWDHLLLVRIDESMYYANTSRIESELQRLVVEHPKAAKVILVMSGVGHLDASSLEMLEEFQQALERSNVSLGIAEAKGPILGQIEGTALMKRIGPDNVFHSTHEAVASTMAWHF